MIEELKKHEERLVSGEDHLYDAQTNTVTLAPSDIREVGQPEDRSQ